jgi:hypothetical protein
VSSAYGGATLNLGWTKEDSPDNVLENRQRFLRTVAGSNSTPALVGMRQIHSARIHELRPPDGVIEGKLATAEGRPVLEGDGLITDVAGVLLAAGTADCVPVLVADTAKRIVAAFHAGWRGTVAGIVESGIEMLRQDYGSRTEDLIAAIGPSIGPCCYSVGEDVRAAFASGFRYAGQLFRSVDTPEPWREASEPGAWHEGEPPRMHLDLWLANRRQMISAGLAEAQIAMAGECTACHRDSQGHRRYFSHRGEYGVTGRMLSVIGIL